MNINETMRELAQYMRMKEEAEAIAESLKDELRQYMTANQLDTLAGDEHKATLKPVTSTRLDTTALKYDHPEIATKYTKTVETKRFTFA